MSPQLELALPSPEPSNTVIINSRCTLRIEGEQRVVVVSGLPVHTYSANDPVAEAYAMVFLVDSGFAQQKEVASAFCRAASSSSGILSPVLKYISSGVCPRNAECGSRELCSCT